MVALLGAAFYLGSSGPILFGILTSQPARRLGDISYSVYLLLLGLALGRCLIARWTV